MDSCYYGFDKQYGNTIMNQHKHPTYLSLCTQVYDLSKPKPPEDACAFYRAYMQYTKGAPNGNDEAIVYECRK